MGLFKKRVDPLSSVAALIDATKHEDDAAIAHFRQVLAPVSTMDVLQGLFLFGQIISQGIKPEQHELVRDVFASVDGTADVQAAVRAVGWAVLVEGTQPALTEAVNTYFTPLIPEPYNLLRKTVFDIIDAVATVCRQLDVKMNWA